MDTRVFEAAAAALPSICFEKPPVCGLILGSGLGPAVQVEAPLLRLPYSDIPGLGASTVVGHTGELVLFELHGARIAAFVGRRHWYEGEGWEPVVLPVELLRRMGAANLLITNASGGIRATLKPGDLVVVRDHINTAGINPLIGPLVPGWGTRFPDQSQVYSETLADLLHQAAREIDVTLTDGVYAFSAGPGYETPAEIRSHAAMGADVVGMSTMPEAVVANAARIRTACLSCVTNMAAGIGGPRLSHDEVIAQAHSVLPIISKLIKTFCRHLAIEETP